MKKKVRNEDVYSAIDSLSKQSTRAMQLPQTLTSCQKLANSDNVLYLEWDLDSESGINYLIGLLKIGCKKLFLYDNQMKAYYGEFVSVLDFYVHQSRQKQGHGHKIFDYMLNYEKVMPYEVALDNPTVTLLSFMAKHYNLTVAVWQNTNFVVFEELFSVIPKGYLISIRSQ
ncbi:unnamed protein product [Thelazia callipaeda]|uniref:Alpha-tubulin N-acetyltransferase n=1 Tax=Thelazia callipaeda TaxID=103827 RepID=A0A158RBU2_THECL|nr:unnamed protein product [Thelazia callipaeda]